MSEQLKIVCVYGPMDLEEIREEAINARLTDFRIDLRNGGITLMNIVDTISDIGYLENAQFTHEESHVLTYEEVVKEHVLLCWCEEISYDHEWAEEDDARNSIRNWIVPCFVSYYDIFDVAGIGDVGKPDDYNKVRIEKNGDMFGKRFWTGGNKPTFEQMKAEKWEGLEGYEYE